MKTFLSNWLLCYLKVNYPVQTVRNFTYTYYFIISISIGISLYFYMCWIVFYALPEFYGIEMVSLREIIEDTINKDCLDKFTSMAENQNINGKRNSGDFLPCSLITNFLNLFVFDNGNMVNSYIKTEELKNTFYVNKKLSEDVIEIPSVENKAVLLFIEYLLDTMQKLEYANRKNE